MLEAGSAVRRVLIAAEPDLTWPELRERAAEVLRACDRQIAQQTPDWLGHCKVLLDSADTCAYASITGADEPVSWRGSLDNIGATTILTLYCVAYGPSDAAMEQIVDSILAGMRELGFGIQEQLDVS